MTRWFLKIDPPAAVGGEQMQLFPRRNGPDPLADRGRGRARDPHDHLPWGQLAGSGGNALHLLLAGGGKENLGPHPPDDFPRERVRDTAPARPPPKSKNSPRESHNTP